MTVATRKIKKFWNEKFQTYSYLHGHTPVNQMEIDRKEYRGDPMGGYKLWMEQQWTDFYQEKGLNPEPHTPYKGLQEWFDKWFKFKYPS